jgi:SAM-dependent methyltransferase
VVAFSEAAGPAIAAADKSIDIVLCQQGFQFFADLGAAAREIHRVLRPGGRLVASTWTPADECAFFGWICQALGEIGEPEIETVMRLPFDHMLGEKLLSPFLEAGFSDASVERQSLPLIMPGGARTVLKAVYATPIGPSLEGLPARQRDSFDAAFLRFVEGERVDEATLGNLTAHVLRASKTR